MMNFESQKHVKFIKRHLSLLPSSHQSHDTNKIAVVFYSIISLSLIGVEVSKEYETSVGWLRKHYTFAVPSGANRPLSGFVGSLTTLIPNVNTMSLPNTLFALLTLKILGDNEFFDNILDRESMCEFVSRCQQPKDGSFTSVLDYKKFSPSPVDATDLRFCFIAVEILHLLGCRNLEDYSKYIDTEKLISYILSQRCDSGGFGSYNEPHAGYTSCSLSALSLLGCLNKMEDDFKESTLSWLLHRQVSNEGCMNLEKENPFFDGDDHGGFQGRENKFADTCYVFWCLNSINVLRADQFGSEDELKTARQYLLERTQNKMIGGFSKNDADDPDLYHTCLGIAALKLMEGTFNGVLFLPSKVILD